MAETVVVMNFCGEEVLVTIKKKNGSTFSGWILETIPSFNFNRLPEVALRSEDVTKFKVSDIVRPFMVVGKEFFVCGDEVDYTDRHAEQLIYHAGLLIDCYFIGGCFLHVYSLLHVMCRHGGRGSNIACQYCEGRPAISIV